MYAFDSQIGKHNQELTDNSRRLYRKEKKRRVTTHVRISRSVYETLKNFKGQHGKTASYWVDKAVKAYLRYGGTN